MLQPSINYNHENTINVIESMRFLKTEWENEMGQTPISTEAKGQTEDIFSEIKEAYGLLEQAVLELLECTISSLEQVDETTTELDEEIGDSLQESIGE